VPRTKEFDRDRALEEAIGIFASHGYEGASTEALLDRMRISRQSMYDTFGDKRTFYLEALQRYTTASVAEIVETMFEDPSPIKGLEAALMSFASKAGTNAADGCLGVSAICEYGRSDRAINAVTDASGATLLAAFERAVAKGKAAGEVASDVDVRAAAQFLRSTLSGLKISARGGADVKSLRKMVRFALRSLR
jgi:TetR/AcrR family transcriptional repressor of nem operon